MGQQTKIICKLIEIGKFDEFRVCWIKLSWWFINDECTHRNKFGIIGEIGQFWTMTKLNLGGLSLMITIFLLTWTEYACNVNRSFCRENLSQTEKVRFYYDEVCGNYGPVPVGRSTINKQRMRKWPNWCVLFDPNFICSFLS